MEKINILKRVLDAINKFPNDNKLGEYIRSIKKEIKNIYEKNIS